MFETIPKHKVFISYHHNNDQYYKDAIIRMTQINDIFIDMSVDTGDINESLDDQRIRTIIRDDYLKDSSVTIVLAGTETKNRKHVDWEIYSSMYDGARNAKSGILVINLPTIYGSQISLSNEDKPILGADESWGPITSYDGYNNLPKRIVDNIKKSDVKICVVNYDRIITDPEGLKKLINIAFNNKATNNYDFSMPMRRINS